MYLEIDEGFPGHRKTLKLCSLLCDPQAGWYMIRLWTWACRSCKDGNLHGMSPSDIEMAVQYRPLDGACYKAMATAGYVDEAQPGEPSAIHGWADHTGGAIARMEAKAIENRQRRAEAKARHDAENGKQQADNVPESREHRTGTIISKTRQDKTSQDKSSDPEGKAPRGFRPDTSYNLRWAIKIAVEKAQPQIGQWAADGFADRDGDAFFSTIVDLERAIPEIQRKIGIFAADPEMSPWNVGKFTKEFNRLGTPKPTRPGQESKTWKVMER